MVDVSDAWELVKTGKFKEALDVADREAAESGSELPLRNKVLALLNLHEYAEAAKLCEQIIDRVKGESDSDFIWLGVALWLSGRHTDASAAWRSGEKAKYTDAAGGIEIPLLLCFAASRTKNEALAANSTRWLKRVSKQSRAKAWPAPIGQYVLGTLDEPELRHLVSPNPLLRQKQMCQLEFYVGARLLASGDADGFRIRMKESCSQGPVSLQQHEYYLGKGEWDRSKK